MEACRSVSALTRRDSSSSIIIVSVHPRASLSRDPREPSERSDRINDGFDMSAAAAAPALRLQYFNIEGPAEKIRLTLSIAKIPFRDDRVAFEDWPSVKPTTPYGQLPVMYVDDEAMAQSDAILRYCGRLAGLYDEQRAREIDEAVSLVEDMRESWYPNLAVGMVPEKYNLEKG